MNQSWESQFRYLRVQYVVHELKNGWILAKYLAFLPNVHMGNFLPTVNAAGIQTSVPIMLHRCCQPNKLPMHCTWTLCPFDLTHKPGCSYSSLLLFATKKRRVFTSYLTLLFGTASQQNQLALKGCKYI